MATNYQGWLDDEEAKKKKKEEEEQQQEQEQAAAAAPVITAPAQNTTVAPEPLSQPAPIMGTDQLPKEKKAPAIEMEGDVATAYNKYIQALQENGNQQSEEVQRLYGEYITAMNNAETQRQQGMTDVRKSMQDYLSEGYGAYEAMLKADEDRIKAAEKEAQEQRANEQRAAIWTGLGEVAASLVNLGFVGGGNAVSQQYHSYQHDWMKKADENWRRNRERIDNMRERQRGIQQHMIQMKMNAGQTLANFDAGEVGAAYNHAVNAAGAKKDAGTAVAGIKGQTAQQVAQAAIQGTTAQIAKNEQDAARRQATAQHNAQIELQYDLHGWTKDPKTGRRVAPTTGVTTKSGSGSGSNIMVSIPPTTEGGKGTRLTINSGSLVATISANVDLFKANDQKAIERILRGDKSADDKAKQLQQYIKTSPEILDLLKLSSVAVDEFDWGQQSQEQSQQNQQNQGTVGSAADLDKVLG